ncbi:MAG: hypothetical protein GC168_03500 [Candidatus Hydrogenedens sp.]|nr:hypothetical protein [Candidatus Hydrogenedens sp.]
MLLPSAWLENLSLAYLALPEFLFLFGWLRLYIALPVAICVGIALWKSRGGFYAPQPDDERSKERLVAPGVTAAIFLLAAACVTATGIGGFTYQHEEQQRNPVFLNDLIHAQWPLAYEETVADRPPQPLPYYFGYYLPAAAVGKVLGWNAAWYALYAWTIGGVFLLVAWFLRLTPAPVLTGSLLFLFFGGLDVLAAAASMAVAYLQLGPPGLVASPLTIAQHAFWGDLDYWSFALAQAYPAYAGKVVWFAGILTRIEFGVHHLVPAWLGVMLILSDWLRPNDNRRTGFLYALMVPSSVLAAMAITPIAALHLLRGGLLRAFSFSNAVAGVLALGLTLLYLATSEAEWPGAWLLSGTTAGALLPHLLVQFLFEFGLYFLLAWPLVRHVSPQLKQLGALGLLMLLISPWYQFGYVNDVGHNVAGIGLLVLLLLISHALWSTNTPNRKWLRTSLAIILCIGAIASAGIAYRAVTWGAKSSPPDPARLRQLPKGFTQEVSQQLRANQDTLFWKYLARPIHPLPGEPLEVFRAWDFSQGRAHEHDWNSVLPAKPGPEGLRIEVSGNGPVLAAGCVPLHAEDFLTVYLDAHSEALHPGGATPPPPQFIVRWSSPEMPLDEAAAHPFYRTLRFERMYNAWRDPTRNEAYLMGDSNWRGTVTGLQFEVWFEPPLTEPAVVVIESIQFMEK